MPSRAMGVTSNRSQVRTEHATDRMSMCIGNVRYSAESCIGQSAQLAFERHDPAEWLHALGHS